MYRQRQRRRRIMDNKLGETHACLLYDSADGGRVNAACNEFVGGRPQVYDRINAAESLTVCLTR